MTGVILGLDFGERRIGVALSDSDRHMAMPLTTILRSSDRQAIEDLMPLLAEHAVAALVLGEPRHLDGSRGPAARRARSFGRKLQRETGLEVTFVNEALSTVEASQRLREAGLSGAALRERLDAVAAQILLQEALEQWPGGGPAPGEGET